MVWLLLITLRALRTIENHTMLISVVIVIYSILRFRFICQDSIDEIPFSAGDSLDDDTFEELMTTNEALTDAAEDAPFEWHQTSDPASMDTLPYEPASSPIEDGAQPVPPQPSTRERERAHLAEIDARIAELQCSGAFRVKYSLDRFSFQISFGLPLRQRLGMLPAVPSFAAPALGVVPC